MVLLDSTVLTDAVKTIGKDREKEIDANQTTAVHAYAELSSAVNQQNAILERAIQDYKGNHATEYRNAMYETESTDGVNTSYMIAFWVYYILAVVLTLVLFLYNLPSSMSIRVLIVIILAIFPFIVYSLEKMIYLLLKYIYSLVTSTVYTTDIYLQ